MSPKPVPHTLIKIVAEHTNLAKIFLQYGPTPAEAWTIIKNRYRYLQPIQFSELQTLCQVDGEGIPTELRCAELQALIDTDKLTELDRKSKFAATRARGSSALTSPQPAPSISIKYQKPGQPKTKGSQGTKDKEKLLVDYAPLLFSFLTSVRINDIQTLHHVLDLLVRPEHATRHKGIILNALREGHPAYAEVLAKLPARLFSQPEKSAGDGQGR